MLALESQRQRDAEEQPPREACCEEERGSPHERRDAVNRWIQSGRAWLTGIRGDRRPHIPRGHSLAPPAFAQDTTGWNDGEGAQVRPVPHLRRGPRTRSGVEAGPATYPDRTEHEVAVVQIHGTQRRVPTHRDVVTELQEIPATVQTYHAAIDVDRGPDFCTQEAQDGVVEDRSLQPTHGRGANEPADQPVPKVPPAPHRASSRTIATDEDTLRHHRDGQPKQREHHAPGPCDQHQKEGQGQQRQALQEPRKHDKAQDPRDGRPKPQAHAERRSLSQREQRWA